MHNGHSAEWGQERLRLSTGRPMTIEQLSGMGAGIGDAREEYTGKLRAVYPGNGPEPFDCTFISQ